MPIVRQEKVVSSLPGTLEANTLYYVRVGVGFDLYLSDSTGTVAYLLNPKVPQGGTAGQVPKKNSSTNFDFSWADLQEIAVGTTAPSSPSVGDLWVDTN